MTVPSSFMAGTDKGSMAVRLILSLAEGLDLPLALFSLPGSLMCLSADS